MSLRADIGLERGGFSLELRLDVEPGRTVVLLGPNGSGKSTLVEALAGLLPIERGEIVLDGRVLERPEQGIRVRAQERPVGVMFQGLWLFPHLSVQDNVAYGLYAGGSGRRQARAEVRGLLESLDLLALAERPASELSGGEAQRVALARALATRPRLLLLDEPLSALDLQSRPRTRALLQQALAAFEGPRLMITHDPLEALLLGDTLVVLENGRVAQAGPAHEVRREPRTEFVATLAGVNLLAGELEGAGGERVLRADGVALPTGPSDLPAGVAVLATIHPSAVKLGEPGARGGGWEAVVASLALEGDRVRVRLDRPAGVWAERDARDLELKSFAPGTRVHASVAADDVYVYRR